MGWRSGDRYGKHGTSLEPNHVSGTPLLGVPDQPILFDGVAPAHLTVGGWNILCGGNARRCGEQLGSSIGQE